MTRTRTFRLVSMAAAFALVAALAGTPGTAGALPDPVRRAHVPPRALAISAVAADDNVPGVDAALPLAVDGALDALAYVPVDGDDVFAVHLLKDQRLVATLTIDPAPWTGLALFGPTATDVWDDIPLVEAIASPEGDVQVLTFTAPAEADYYLNVWAMPKMDPVPADEFPGNDGWAGPYNLVADAGGLLATSITIRTSATTTYIGKTPILSGAVTPQAMIGVNIVCYVKKPGKTYWTYSSNRTVYNLNGSPAWQYKYYFKPGMAKGSYTFKAVAPAPNFASSGGFLTSTSPMTVTIRVR